MMAELNDKNANIESITGQALENREILSEILDGLKSKAETYRYNCYKVLYSISQTHPGVLYPECDRFVESLSSVSSYHKMSAIHLIANLTLIDQENKFEKIFDKYYSLLDDTSMVVAYYVASVSGRIAKAKPKLEKAITDKLLNIDKTHHQPSRKELIKTGVIEAFNDYFEASGDKEIIINFVRQQVNSQSSKTRKTAKTFLTKWDKK